MDSIGSLPPTPRNESVAPPAGGVVVSTRGIVLFLSPSAEAMTGWPLAEAHGRPLADVVQLRPDGPETPFDAGAVIAGGQSARRLLARVSCRSGGDHRVQLTTIPAVDEAGSVVGITLVLEDREPRRTLPTSIDMAHLRAVLQGMPVMMDAFDEQQRLVVWNAECERVTGYRADEIVGNPNALAMLYPDAAYRERMLDLWRRTRQDYRNWEWEITCKDGSTRIIEWSNVSITLPIPGWATWGIGVDVTERRKLEAQLGHAQKMEAIGTLAGGVAHDFNNILAAILGNAQLAHEDLEPGHAASRSVSEIVHAAERGRTLVEQILAFSHKRAPEKRLLHLRPIVEESAKLLRATLPTGIELATHFEEPLPAVVADATQLQQIVLNLGTNAWHAIEGGHGRIELRLSPVVVRSRQVAPVPAGQWAKLTVADTGRGMDRDTLHRIFEPYFTTKGPGKGTGLGLPVVHGAVQSHDGHIHVASTPGVGTTFEIYLPAAPAAETAVAAPPAQSAPHRGNGEQVLYVDDERALVALAIRGLGRLGYRVRGCASAIEALACVRDDPGAIDLMVTDNNMPEASGIELTRDVRALRPDLPVIIISGYVDDDLRAAAAAAGIGEVLYKPSTLADLSRAIGRLLSSRT